MLYSDTVMAALGGRFTDMFFPLKLVPYVSLLLQTELS